MYAATRKTGGTRGQVALEFLMVVTMFYLILGWPVNYYLSLGSSSAPDEKQLEGAARAIGMLANRACVSSYNSSVSLTYEMPCFYHAGVQSNYLVAAGGNTINVSTANVTIVKSTLCSVSASFESSCGSQTCFSSSNANVAITSGACP